MSFFNRIKAGFAYGFGGRLGWEAGGFVWGLIRKVVIAVLLVLGFQVVDDGLVKYAEISKEYRASQQKQGK
jgi:hypothetical protein